VRPQGEAQRTFPLALAYCQCTPLFPWAADTVSIIGPPDPANDAWIRLQAYDATGNRMGWFQFQPPAPWYQWAAANFTWDPAYNQLANPLGIAAALEFAIQQNDQIEYAIGLPQWTPFLFWDLDQAHRVLEENVDITQNADAHIYWDGTGGAAFDLSDYWRNPLLSVMTSAGPPWPARTYTRWKLELATQNPPPPMNLPVIFASGPVGPIVNGVLTPWPNQYLWPPDAGWDSHVTWTPGQPGLNPPWTAPPTFLFANPAVAPWANRLYYRIVVW
jgi:hypothetical protein